MQCNKLIYQSEEGRQYKKIDSQNQPTTAGNVLYYPIGLVIFK